MGMLRAVGHLDADCFYVSAERVRDPFLADKPVGVLGNNGACVIAKSYEMKAKGVRTGEPIWDAMKLCPDGIYVKRDFEWYEVLSRQMLDVTRELSPAVEYYSIDEFFFVAEADSPADMLRTSLQIRDRIFEATRLPVTVGVARTRTLAKLMSDQFKPFGAGAILTRAEEEKFLGAHEVTAICGIAARRAARVAAYGVRTCLDLCKMRRSLVRELLTVTGENIWRELNGESVVPLQTERPPHQTLSRGGSIGWATDDPHRVFAWTVRNLERLIEELHFHKVRPARLTVWLRHADGPDTLGEIELESPSDRFDRLLDAARAGLRRAWRSCRVSHMHLVASKLRGQGPVQRSLFEPPTGRDVVGEAKRAVNAKLGRFMLRSGATLPLKELYSDPSWGYDICDVRGKLCF